MNYSTSSNFDGFYTLELPALVPSSTFTIIVKNDVERFSYTFTNDALKYKVPKTKFSVQVITGVDINSTSSENIQDIEMVDVKNIPVPGGSVEKLLVFSAPVSSNNELSNSYNVRGGNYNENLVYVNGIQIYRPFLTRSGQQEGMSFINPNFVENISFSAGGFSANYGDRLSSVLDITYKTPTAFKGSLSAGMLGASFHIEDKVSPRFNYILGGRYRSNGYLLNSLPTKEITTQFLSTSKS